MKNTDRKANNECVMCIQKNIGIHHTNWSSKPANPQRAEAEGYCE